MEVLLSILPVHFHTALMTAVRLKNSECWNESHTGHSAILNSHKEDLIELSMRSDKCTPQYLINRRFEILIPLRTEWETETLFNPDDLVIYTDGSKMESGSGAGIFSIAPPINASMPLGKFATITQAEAYAILETCAILKSHNTQDRKIYICTDSQASLKALNSHCFTSNLAIECFKELSRLTQNNEVTLIWVPGHNDIEGNEAADALAKSGSKNEYKGPEPVIGLSYATQRSAIRHFFNMKHYSEWQETDTCSHSKTIIKGPDLGNTKFLLNKSRDDLRCIMGAITGHCTLNKHLNRMRLADSPLSRRCNEEDETPLHLLTSCPALANERRKHMDQPFLDMEQTQGLKIETFFRFMKVVLPMN